MIKSISVSKARGLLSSIAKSIGEAPEVIVLTRKGKPVLAVMPWGMYESIAETIAITSDPALMSQVRKGINDMKSKRLIPWTKVQRQHHVL